MVRVPFQQAFEHGDRVVRTVGAEIDLGQRQVRGLVCGIRCSSCCSNDTAASVSPRAAVRDMAADLA
jgi:hypothetical protein